ncbi:hypothetical protein BJY04DRAFT_200052 [Aspergillus karnatakaensis]|uniref:BTB/POZ domain-containing protein n=1 Tax=Aspergillus karnatakaensis TaxID=1810916 RepID=UPI003CCD2619
MSTDNRIPYMKFLESDTIKLHAKDSPRTFSIHSKLVASISRPITAAFENNFSEAKNKTYIFEDTTEDTLCRFIEWAYTSFYTAPPIQYHSSEVLDGRSETAAQNSGSTAESENKQQQAAPCPTPQEPRGFPEETPRKSTNPPPVDPTPTTANNALVAHMHVYIFASVYLVDDLQRNAMALIADMLERQWHEGIEHHFPSIFACFRLAFSKLHRRDKLLVYLACYAAFLLDSLKTQREFHTILYEYPLLSILMVQRLHGVRTPPWAQCAAPESQVQTAPKEMPGKG